LLYESNAYHGVFLDESSIKQLLDKFRRHWSNEEGWEEFAHHMTIGLGPLPDNLLARRGDQVRLQVVSFAQDDKVKAVGVNHPDDIQSNNTQPHITLAVNRGAGGKPYLSNKLTNWEPIQPFDVIGVLDVYQDENLSAGG
tara:strand:- start:303 stop:722 length:420 start_codon:yes stop_codon:yes gene_type:complete